MDNEAKTDAMVWAMFAAIGVSFFAGIGLAIYYDNPAWLILSVVPFCIMYAG